MHPGFGAEAVRIFRFDNRDPKTTATQTGIFLGTPRAWAHQTETEDGLAGAFE